MWFNLYGCQGARCKIKNRLNKIAFLACFWHYVGQSDNHIGWTTSLSFASIYFMYLRTNLWQFGAKILRIGGFEKLSFLSRPFWIFYFFQNVYDCHEVPSLNNQCCIRCFWWYMISVSGPFGQPGQYMKKSWGPIMSNFWGRFFHVFEVKKKDNILLKTLQHRH